MTKYKYQLVCVFIGYNPSTNKHGDEEFSEKLTLLSKNSYEILPETFRVTDTMYIILARKKIGGLP